MRIDEYIKKSFALMMDGRYRQWDVVAAKDDGYIVVSHEVMYHIRYGDTNRWRDCFLRGYLHDVWMAPIREALSLKDIPAGAILPYRTETSRDSIFILSKEEHRDWFDFIPNKSNPFWLRTPYGNLRVPYVWVATPEGHHIGESVHNSNVGVVPALFLASDAVHELVSVKSATEAVAAEVAAAELEQKKGEA